MAQAQSLPTQREVLTNMISTLSYLPQTSAAQSSNNPLHDAPPQIKSLLTTLHIIFPHLLLPALDLLDRQMITKIIKTPQTPHEIGHLEDTFYHVQSSQSAGRSKTTMSYIVRLKAWNCTCASFAFSAFPASASEEVFDIENTCDSRNSRLGEDTEYGEATLDFGGLSVDGKDGGAVPACKHILACILADRWEMLAQMVPERRISREEMAALGAGY